MPSHRFNCLIQLVSLSLSTPTVSVQLTVITPNEHLQSPSISYSPPFTFLNQLFAFSTLLRYSKHGSPLYADQHLLIRLVGRNGKEAFHIGEGRFNLAALANKNNRMYENEFEVRIGGEGRVMMQVRIAREERTEGGGVTSGQGLGVPNSTVLGASRNRVMVSAGGGGFSDMSEMSENSATSSKTFSQRAEHHPRHSTPTSSKVDIQQQNQLLRRKLEQLYNKIGNKQQSPTSLSQHQALSPEKLQELPQTIIPPVVTYEPIAEDKYQFDIELVLEEKRKVEMKLADLKKEYDLLLEKYSASEKARREIISAGHSPKN